MKNQSASYALLLLWAVPLALAVFICSAYPQLSTLPGFGDLAPQARMLGAILVLTLCFWGLWLHWGWALERTQSQPVTPLFAAALAIVMDLAVFQLVASIAGLSPTVKFVSGAIGSFLPFFAAILRAKPSHT